MSIHQPHISGKIPASTERIIPTCAGRPHPQFTRPHHRHNRLCKDPHLQCNIGHPQHSLYPRQLEEASTIVEYQDQECGYHIANEGGHYTSPGHNTQLCIVGQWWAESSHVTTQCLSCDLQGPRGRTWRPSASPVGKEGRL